MNPGLVLFAPFYWLGAGPRFLNGAMVVAYAAGVLGIPSPPEVSLEDAGLSATAMRFYGESKRVSNALAKAELGWRPAYPTFREGLAAILATEVS